MNLVYCPRCSKLFAKHFREVCNSCYEELEMEYERCVAYLRKNKGLNIQQLAEETDIPSKQITRWVREGRLSVADAPNMSYTCEMCENQIRIGNLCEDCRTRLYREVNGVRSTDNRLQQGGQGKSTYQISKD